MVPLLVRFVKGIKLYFDKLPAIFPQKTFLTHRVFYQFRIKGFFLMRSSEIGLGFWRIFSFFNFFLSFRAFLWYTKKQ